MNMNTIFVRKANYQDASTILRFVTELARYENAESEVVATIDDINATICSDNATTHALICEFNGSPIGFAVYFFNYSTWQGKNGLYLEDLYVTPEARGLGAGKALFKALAKIAQEKCCGRFEWSVLDWNKPAIDFYESIGAKPKSEWIGYRLTQDQFSSLVEE